MFTHRETIIGSSLSLPLFTSKGAGSPTSDLFHVIIFWCELATMFTTMNTFSPLKPWLTESKPFYAIGFPKLNISESPWIFQPYLLCNSNNCMAQYCKDLEAEKHEVCIRCTFIFIVITSRDQECCDPSFY